MADEATPTEEQAPDGQAPEVTSPEDAQPEEQQPGDDEKFDPDRALDKIRKLNSENKNLRDAKKAAEAKAATADEKDTRIQALEAENLRIRIGAKHGLPEELIDRLKGNTEEEILADAEKLLDLVSTRKPPPSQRPSERPRGGTDPTATGDEPTDVRKLGERMFRR